MNRLQKALGMNAVFSSASGIIMILGHKQIATLFEVANTTVFWMVGLVLIYFALTIGYEVKKQRRLAVIWIIIQDALWVLGSIILLLFNPFKISFEGNYMIAFIALIVLFMAVHQTYALKSKKNTLSNDG